MIEPEIGSQEEISDAFSGAFAMGSETRKHILSLIKTWMSERTIVPESDPRRAEVERQLSDWVDRLEIVLDPKNGVVIRDTSDLGLRLERGLTWLRGGDWQSVVLSAVDKESPKP